MKTLKLVGMLTLIVVSFSLLVWVANDVTAPIIAERKIIEANAAKFDVLPSLDATADADALDKNVTTYDLSGTSITELYVFEGKGYIYKAEFGGFASTIVYLVGVDTNNNVTGLKILEQNDSPGYGAAIGEAWFSEQFSTGKTAEGLQDGEFDGISGASATTGGFTGSINKVMSFHLTTFGGVVAETFEEKLARLSGELFPDAVFTDVTADNEASNAFEILFEAKIADDVVGYVYYIEAGGANYAAPTTHNHFLIGINKDGEFTGFSMIETTDTSGIIDYYKTTDFSDEFVGDSIDDLSIDADGGATETFNKIETAVKNAIVYHSANFSVITEGETEEQKFARLTTNIFGVYTDLEDITRDNPASHDIDKIANITNDGTYLGVSYFVEAKINDVVYKLVVGINPAGEVVGTQYIYEEDVYTEAEITAITDLVLVYHTANGLGRPVAPVLDDADLLLAFAGADHFVSIYDTLTYNSTIYNVYEAQDATDAVLGYVYHFKASGRSQSHIEIVYGFNILGSSVTIGVLTGDTESWDDAAFDFYTGGETWPNTTWLDNWENQVIDDIDDSQIDTVAGVTDTTGGVKAAIEEVIDFHKAEIIGGGS